MTTSPDIIPKAPVFSGEYRPVLDPKKRLTIPSRWRTNGLDELFIFKSFARGCLVAMPQAVLEETGKNKAKEQALSAEVHQAFKDKFFASAVNFPIDSQGRMVLTDDFCQFARLEKEAVLAGSGEKFDIWNPEAWGQWAQSIDPVYTTIMKGLGL